MHASRFSKTVRLRQLPNRRALSQNITIPGGIRSGVISPRQPTSSKGAMLRMGFRVTLHPVAFDFKWHRVSELCGVLRDYLASAYGQLVPITRLSLAASTTATETR
jgi:hypothetical protein